MLRESGSFVLVAGRELLNGNQLSVARAVIAHAGGVVFRRLSPTQGEGAMLVGRPCALIVADDGLGFAVAKCDAVDGHSSIPPDGWLDLNPPRKALWLQSSAILAFPKHHQAMVGTGVMSGRSAPA